MNSNAVPFKVETSQELNERGVQTCRVTLAPDEREPVKIQVEGNCPKCDHEIFFSEPLLLLRGTDGDLDADATRAVLAALRSTSRPLQARNIEVICGCGTIHPGTPPGQKGCGRSWTLHVEWGNQ